MSRYLKPTGNPSGLTRFDPVSSRLKRDGLWDDSWSLVGISGFVLMFSSVFNCLFWARGTSVTRGAPRSICFGSLQIIMAYFYFLSVFNLVTACQTSLVSVVIILLFYGFTYIQVTLEQFQQLVYLNHSYFKGRFHKCCLQADKSFFPFLRRWFPLMTLWSESP